MVHASGSTHETAAIEVLEVEGSTTSLHVVPFQMTTSDLTAPIEWLPTATHIDTVRHDTEVSDGTIAVLSRLRSIVQELPFHSMINTLAVPPPM